MTQDYYGTKRVTAWHSAKNGEAGYAVKYADGYQSWSPKAAFEEAYQPLHALSFGHAIEALKTGHRVARSGWNGKGMYLAYQAGYPDGISINANTQKALGLPEGTICRFLPYLTMKTADGSFVPWLASQTDMLANDWQIVE